MARLTTLQTVERQLVLEHLEEEAPAETRFRKLLGKAAWNRLPKAIQRRFGRHMKDGKSIVYKGIITETQLSAAGKVLANLCRLIGAPLPYEEHPNGTPAIVTVTEDKAANGQFWTRTYGREGGFPQIIHSSKRFQGKTGLEEYIGYGIAMDLTVSADEDAIVFSSAAYHFDIGKFRVTLPRFLEPGNVKVTHQDKGEGYFAFVLEVTHPLLGRLVYQRGIFCEHETIIV